LTSEFDIEIQACNSLLSPWQFHQLCQTVCRKTGQQNLYFGRFPRSILTVHPKINPAVLQRFFDDLAEYVRHHNQPKARFHLVTDRGQIEIQVCYIGSGAIGKVVRLQVNGDTPLAFKVFFDPDFVWPHGPWGEIPVGIYLKASGVTRDITEFFAAGLTWSIVEWIDEDTHPHKRRGIDYAVFARRKNLTPLNPLNISNYNRYGMRVDLGGIQTNTFGRRWRDGFYTVWFYTRKIRREGWRSMAPYFSPQALHYALQRLGYLLSSSIVGLHDRLKKQNSTSRQ